MNAIGYGSFLLVCSSSFSFGLLIGWIGRTSSRRFRVQQAGIASLVLALFFPVLISLLALGAVGSPFFYPEGRIAIFTLLAATFLSIVGLVGIPLVAGVAIPPTRTRQRSEHATDGNHH